MQPGQHVVVNQTKFEYLVTFADRGKTWHRFERAIICPEDGVRGDAVCIRWRLDGVHEVSFRLEDVLEHTHPGDDGPMTCPACYAVANQVPMG